MRLYLVRHGEYQLDDPNQALSIHGIEETKSVAKLIKNSSFEIDEILHSSKIRAKQTAEILAEILTPKISPIQKEGLQPTDSAAIFFQELQHVDHNIMVVGHLPFLEKLLALLLTGEEHHPLVYFSPSCTVFLQGEKRQWHISWVVSTNLTHTSLA